MCETRLCKLTIFKIYVDVFIYFFCTKVVYLEVVMDLSTEDFLTPSERFIALRDLLSDIFSDSGTNLVRADKQSCSVYHCPEGQAAIANMRFS